MKLLLVLLLVLAGCFEVVDLDPPQPDAGFDGDAGVEPDAALDGDGGLPDASL